jgi:hypothetical protein
VLPTISSYRYRPVLPKGNASRTIKSSNQGQGINVDDDNMLECLVALAPEETVVQIWQTSLNDA